MKLTVPMMLSRRKECTAVQIHIPVLPPSANRIWRMGNGHIHRSDKYGQWLMKAGLILNRQHPGLIPGHYRLTMTCKRPRRHTDLDNLIKPTNDLLAFTGVVENDRLCDMIDIRWVTHGDPGMVLRVERISV